MNTRPKWLGNHNPSYYNVATRQYVNKSGSFMTRAEADVTRWLCQKCGKGFPTRLKLREHRDDVHSY